MSASEQPLSPTEARRWTEIGILSALALLLSYLESFVPIPIPGVKLGLANIPVLVCLAESDLWGAFFVGLVKVAATSLLFGNPVTFAYSFVGTLLAYAFMAPLTRLRTMRLEMVSVVGALAHETGQLLVAQVLLGTPLVWYAAPLLGVAGVITGAFCGVLATRLAELLAEDQVPAYPMSQKPSPSWGASSSPDLLSPEHQAPDHLPASLVLAAYVVLVVATMHARNAMPLCAYLAASILACVASHTTPQTMSRALAPALPLALVASVAQLASSAGGATLVGLGPLRITEGAIVAIAVMLARLATISLASVALVSFTGRDGLAALAHKLVSPLRALGVRTQGPELALSTALALVPTLSRMLTQELEPREMLSRAFWQERFPALVGRLHAEALLEASEPSYGSCTSSELSGK